MLPINGNVNIILPIR